MGGSRGYKRFFSREASKNLPDRVRRRVHPTTHQLIENGLTARAVFWLNSAMNTRKLPLLLAVVPILLCQLPLQSAETNKSETAVSIFKDKKLEAAVRKYVFEKRDTEKPILAEDVVSLSTISATGLG